MGIGDWGLGIGDWAQSPIPNPQSPYNILLKKFNIPKKIKAYKIEKELCLISNAYICLGTNLNINEKVLIKIYGYKKLLFELLLDIFNFDFFKIYLKLKIKKLKIKKFYF